MPEFAAVDPTADPAYAELQAEKAVLQEEIRALAEDSSSALADADAAIAEAQGAMDEAAKRLADVDARTKGQRRIDELKAREKLLASEYERLEGELFLTEEFVRAKVAMLTERINARFSVARFKLFDEQVNGGLVETCEVTLNGVPYGSLNHGARVNVGLEIVDVLADHFGFSPPIVIDNAESVTALRPTKGQQIRLVVSAPDKALRFAADAPPATSTEPPQTLEALF